MLLPILTSCFAGKPQTTQCCWLCRALEFRERNTRIVAFVSSLLWLRIRQAAKSGINKSRIALDKGFHFCVIGYTTHTVLLAAGARIVQKLRLAIVSADVECASARSMRADKKFLLAIPASELLPNLKEREGLRRRNYFGRLSARFPFVMEYLSVPNRKILRRG